MKKYRQIIRCCIAALLIMIMLLPGLFLSVPVSAEVNDSGASYPYTQDNDAVFYLSNMDGTIVFKYTISGFRGKAATDAIYGLAKKPKYFLKSDEYKKEISKVYDEKWAARPEGDKFDYDIPQVAKLSWKVEVVKGSVSTSAAPRITKIETYITTVASRSIQYKVGNVVVETYEDRNYADSTSPVYNDDYGEAYYGISISFDGVTNGFGYSPLGVHINSNTLQVNKYDTVNNRVTNETAYVRNYLYKADGTWAAYTDDSSCLKLPLATLARFDRLQKVDAYYTTWNNTTKSTKPNQLRDIKILSGASSLDTGRGTMTLGSQLYSFGGLTWNDFRYEKSAGVENVQVKSDVPVYKLDIVPNRYTIQYASNGGGFGAATPQVVNYGNNFALRSPFTAYDGWMSQYSYAVVRSSDNKVYCKDNTWKPLSQTQNSEWYLFAPGSTQNIFGIMQADGSVAGWVNPDATDDTFTFYAQWTPLPNKYTIETLQFFRHSYDGSTTKEPSIVKTVTHGDTVYADWMSSSDLSSSGKFKGMYVKDVKGYNAYGDGIIRDVPWTATGNGTFLAFYKPKGINVVFHRNTSAGDTVTETATYYTDNVEYENGQSRVSFNLPAWSDDKPGYEMDTWSERQDGAYATSRYSSAINRYDRISAVGAWWVRDAYDYEINNKPAGDELPTVHLYMTWLPKTYRITPDDNGGSGGSEVFYEQYNDSYYFYRSDNWVKTSSVTTPTRPGYDFLGYYYGDIQIVNASGSIVVGADYFTSDATITAKWKSNAPTKAAYKVEHYKQNADDDNWTLADTDTGLEGGIGDTPACNPKNYTGFTYDSSLTSAPAVKADGSTVVKLYYKRNTHTVTLTKGTGISEVTGAGTYRYGQSVTIDAAVSTGYTWTGWSGYDTQTSRKHTFTMPDRGVAYTAKAADITVPEINATPSKSTNPDADNDAVKSIDVTISVTESGSGLASTNSYKYGFSTSVSIPPEQWTAYSTTTGTESFTVSLPDLGCDLNGYYYLWVRRINDRAGNKSISSTALITTTGYHVFGIYTFDNEAPAGTVSYIENNITLGLYDNAISPSPYAVMTINNPNDDIAGIAGYVLRISDAADPSNSVDYIFTPDAGTGTYTCRFNLYDSLTGAENIEKVHLQIIATDKLGNEATIPITRYDFGNLQTGTAIRGEDIGYMELSDISDASSSPIRTAYTYIRDNFRVEAYIENISYKASGTTFMGGHKGQLRIYVFGYVDNVSADFGSIKKFILPEYDTNPDLSRTGIVPPEREKLYLHEFFVPLYCASSTYTDTTAFGYKGNSVQKRCVIYDVSDTLAYKIKTILKYNAE